MPCSTDRRRAASSAKRSSLMARRCRNASNARRTERPQILIHALVAAEKCGHQYAFVRGAHLPQRRVAAVVVHGDASFDAMRLQNSRREVEQQLGRFMEYAAAPEPLL